ncbi:hypothetical protein [Larkinella soli]|uniref:hypothetical protein n=1 Tax=Larkinella soli TaxID=1770527 RepID=UPI000FFBA710|nr:hypothetical protein [Larkinella soli]
MAVAIFHEESQIAEQEASYQKLGRDRMHYHTAMAQAGGKSGPSAREIAAALADELEKRPRLQLNNDENGFTRTIIEKTTKRVELNKRRYLS